MDGWIDCGAGAPAVCRYCRRRDRRPKSRRRPLLSPHCTKRQTRRSVGGRIFLAPGHLPPGASKRFAVCPYGLHPQDAARLERTSPCFAAVHPACRVTLYWVHLSSQRRRLLQPTPRMPYLAPLPHRLPLPSFAGVVLSASGFDEAQKTTVKFLVELLGGKLLGSFRPADCAYLVVPTMVGAHESTLKKVGAAWWSWWWCTWW